MRDLHLDVQGRQILLVFRAKRLMPVDTISLEHVRELWRKHILLSKASQREPLTGFSHPEKHPIHGRGDTQ